MKWGVLVGIFILLLVGSCSQQPSVVEENITALNNLGVYYSQQGEDGKAKEYFEKVLDIELRHEPARKNLALIYFKEGNYDESIAHFEVLISFDPDNPGYHYDLAISYAENCRQNEVCDLEKAIEHFETADNLDPGFQMARQNIEALIEVKKQLDAEQPV